MVISPGGTSTTSVTSVQKTDHPLGPLGLGWNIASFSNADLHNVLVHQAVQQMSTFWWYPRYPWYLTKPVNQACVLCRTMLGYPWGLHVQTNGKTMANWLALDTCCWVIWTFLIWIIHWLGHIYTKDQTWFPVHVRIKDHLLWLVDVGLSSQWSKRIAHSIYLSLVPSWKFQAPSETVFWDLFLGSKHILKPELAAPVFLFGHLSWNQHHFFLQNFCQTSKPPDKSSATLSGCHFLSATRDPGAKLSRAFGVTDA